ncbi:hypothetical protein LSTR_LSTR001940 [Laodelphax striatellus]|uniref:MD-2-related lipid-recognition domain-containing protein n=1 Tax=Laodelphax striatellus TaxID=195883 RepID=A0A482XHJ2_LAOST|nr:hypothetical protein LSTR_LSTR001940 [Laodelphax striatellus]
MKLRIGDFVIKCDFNVLQFYLTDSESMLSPCHLMNFSEAGKVGTMIIPIKYYIFLCLLALQAAALWEEIAGPYNIALRHLSQCDKSGSANVLEPMKARKYNRTHFAYTGLINVAVGFDDNSNIRILASNKGTNGRYNNVIDFEMKSCDIIRKFGRIPAMSVYKHCNRTFKCPDKSFTCKLDNWIMDYSLQNIPALPYGEYKLDLLLIKIKPFGKRELISCVRFHGIITPKIQNPSSINNTKT